MSTLTQTRPTTPTTPTTPATRYPLGWLRALAALSVVIFHAYQDNRTDTWPLSGNAHQLMLGTDLFVDMFFVLSAFVLWLPVARATLDGRSGRPGWVVLFRRIARLLPLYLTVVLVVWGVSNPSLPGHWQDLLLHLTFTHVYSDTYIFWTDGPAWSLAVEFHFYVLIALTIPLVQRATRRVRSTGGRIAVAMSLPAACGVAGLAYLAWQIMVAQPPESSWSAWFNPLAKAPDFAIGMTLAVLCAAGVRLGPVLRRLVATAGLGALAVLAMARPLHGPETNWWHPLFAVSIAAALSAIVLHEPPYPAWMSWRPLAWIGGLGYGIYLIHEPVLRWVTHLGLAPEPRPGLAFLVTAAVVAVPTIGLAWVSSRTVEAAGGKALGLVDGDRPRDYYAHLDRPAREPGRSEP